MYPLLASRGHDLQNGGEFTSNSSSKVYQRVYGIFKQTF